MAHLDDDDGDGDGRSLEYVADQERWGDAMRRAGHTPILDHRGDTELMAFCEGFHNGPKCAICGFSICMHCHPGGVVSIVCAEVEETAS